MPYIRLKFFNYKSFEVALVFIFNFNFDRILVFYLIHQRNTIFDALIVSIIVIDLVKGSTWL